MTIPVKSFSSDKTYHVALSPDLKHCFCDCPDRRAKLTGEACKHIRHAVAKIQNDPDLLKLLAAEREAFERSDPFEEF